jgi:hypothetical protein
MSRRREFEIIFGSDSFLDVIANIVGILIILIVIAGVRVSQSPPKTRPALPELALPAESTPAEEEIPVTPAAPPEIVISTQPETPAEPLPELVPPQELVDGVREIQAEVASMTVQANSLGEAIAKANQSQLDVDKRLQTARSLLQDRASELKASAERDAEQLQNLELTRQALIRLQAQVEEAEKKSANIEKLEHRITPVSRMVTGRELHFRLEKGRVAEVPLDALVERLKEHIERRKDWIVKNRQHKGMVGPINGFNLEYIIGVDNVSTLEEMRTGMGGYRLSMRYWEIHPESTLRGEPDDVATRQGSRFHQALLSADKNTTLTFWVYPDSYPLYRQLQKFAHDNGFPVAARPLPDGVAISGSPNGTKSASQ